MFIGFLAKFRFFCTFNVTKIFDISLLNSEYQESLKMLTDDMVEQIKEMADNRAGFHIEFERFNQEEQINE